MVLSYSIAVIPVSWGPFLQNLFDVSTPLSGAAIGIDQCNHCVRKADTVERTLTGKDFPDRVVILTSVMGRQFSRRDGNIATRNKSSRPYNDWWL
jgi:hypothetical protein